MNKVWQSVINFFRRMYSRVSKAFKIDSRNNSQNTSDEIVYAELNKNVLNKLKSRDTIKRGNNNTIYTKVKGGITPEIPIYENINLNRDPIYENIVRKPPLPQKNKKVGIENIKNKCQNVSNNRVSSRRHSSLKYEDR